MSSKYNERVNFGRIAKVIDYPDFLDVQLKSFQEFFQLQTSSEDRKFEGLFK
ncbi:MAG: DNA-directed RNA polymerase subunit beta, partial [Pseudoalteromonas distincta]